MKVIIIWDIFAEFGKKIARKIQSYKEGEIYKKLLIKIHLIAYYDDHKKKNTNSKFRMIFYIYLI
jgi:hypothetical protein